MTDLKACSVWDAGVRWFHWINLLCMLGLIAVGVVILNAKVLGVPSDGKILLKTVHVWIGYVFAVNLLWRLVWAFIGGPHARWRAILPGGRGYMNEVRSYIADFRAGRPRICSTRPSVRGLLAGWPTRVSIRQRWCPMRRRCMTRPPTRRCAPSANPSSPFITTAFTCCSPSP